MALYNPGDPMAMVAALMGRNPNQQLAGGVMQGPANFDERFPRAIWGGGQGPSIDAAFSPDPGAQHELTLGKALDAAKSHYQPLILPNIPNGRR